MLVSDTTSPFIPHRAVCLGFHPSAYSGLGASPAAPGTAGSWGKHMLSCCVRAPAVPEGGLILLKGFEQ